MNNFLKIFKLRHRDQHVNRSKTKQSPFYCSYLGQIALSAVHDGHRHAAPYVDHLHRGPEPVSGSGARGNGKPDRISFVERLSILILSLSPPSKKNSRPSTWLARPASPRPSPASRRTRRRCCWRWANGPSSPPRSTSPSRPSWKGSASCGKIPTTSRKAFRRRGRHGRADNP